MRKPWSSDEPPDPAPIAPLVGSNWGDELSPLTDAERRWYAQHRDEFEQAAAEEIP